MVIYLIYLLPIYIFTKDQQRQAKKGMDRY